MRKRQFRLTEKEICELRQAETKCTDVLSKTRYQAVRLYGTGYALQTILDVTSCSQSALRKWIRVYRQRGLTGLVDQRAGGNSAKLTRDQRREVALRLQQLTPHQVLGIQTHSSSGQFWTVEDLQIALHRWYGVQYQSRISYYNLLEACGFSYQRTEKVFKSQRPADIASFEEFTEKN